MHQLSDYKNIIEVLSAALSPLIAIFLGYITYHQFKLDKQKHRLELYDRRFAVFEEIKKFLSAILRDGKTDYNQLLNLLHQTNQATFLFDDEVSSYIDALYKRGVDSVLVEQQLHGEGKVPVGPERSKLAQESSEHIRFFVDQFNASKKIFTKYLKFDLY